MDRQYKDQKKHGQAIQRQKEIWTGNTTTKRNIDIFLFVVVLPVHVSFGLCIACPCIFWSLYFLSMFLLVFVFPVPVSLKKHGQTIQRPKEKWTGNTTTKRNMDRQYNDQKKHGQAIQLPKETWTDNTTTKRNMDRQYNDKRKHVFVLFLLAIVLFAFFLLVIVLFVLFLLVIVLFVLFLLVIVLFVFFLLVIV
jgi:uncharacterized membrane protein